MFKLGNRRLLKLAAVLFVADAIHRANKQPTYNQGVLTHDCGTPACAWGHYGFIPSVQKRGINIMNISCSLCETAAAEFGITISQAHELFGIFGCNHARTAKQAARYITNFVKRRQSEHAKAA